MNNPFQRRERAPAAPTTHSGEPEVLGKGFGLNGSYIVESGVSHAACLATNLIMVDGARLSSTNATRTTSARRTRTSGSSRATRTMTTWTKSRTTACTP